MRDPITTRRSYMTLAAVAGVGLAGCLGDDDDGADGNGNGDDGADGNGDGTDGKAGLDPGEACDIPTGGEPEDHMPPAEDYGQFELAGGGTNSGRVTREQINFGGDQFTWRSEGFEGADDAITQGTDYVTIVIDIDEPIDEFTSGDVVDMLMSVDTEEKVGVYVLDGDRAFIVGGPNEAEARDLMTAFPGISEACAEAARVDR